MKRLKKIFSFVLVIAMLLVQMVPTTGVSAVSGTNNDSGSITIENAIVGKTYSAYQILKLESYDTSKGAYTYTIADGWSSFINSSAIKGVYVEVDAQGYVTWVDGADAKTFAQLALAYAKENSVVATQKQTASSTTVTFTGLNLGYYLVDSSVGALCSLTTTKPSAEAEEKNTVPTVDKTVEEDSTGVYGDDNDADIGQTVNFKTVITASDGAENYVLYDTMSEGLTLDASSIKVTFGDKTLVTGTDYIVSTTTTGYTFVITFAKDFTDTLKANDQIVVTYSAVLNEKAVIGGEGNPNTTYLTYGDTTDTTNKTPKDTTITYTYSFDLIKTDKDKVLLDGAVFRLYDSETDGNVIAVVKVSEGVYRVAKKDETGEDIVVTNGKVTIKGLDGSTIYWLEEVTAPNGYNKLASRVKVVIESVNLDATTNTENVTDSETGATTTITKYVSGGVQVVNNNGVELPITGGMGTVLFIVIGSLMITLFGVLLVTKLRISKMEA